MRRQRQRRRHRQYRPCRRLTPAPPGITLATAGYATPWDTTPPVLRRTLDAARRAADAETKGSLGAADKRRRDRLFTGHPIYSEIIIERLSKAELPLARPGATLPLEALFPHGQDHYGGLEANDALAWLAGLKPEMEVVDFCTGRGAAGEILRHVRCEGPGDGTRQGDVVKLN